MNPVVLLDRLQSSFAGFWAVHDARERTMLAVAAVVVLSCLSYVLLFNPALTGRDRLNKDLPVLRQQLALIQALSKEAASLSGRSAPKITAPSKEVIETTLARKGLKSQSVILTGDLVKVQLTAASFAGTMNWLDEMQRTVLLSVTEANIVALNSPDMVNATITLRQQRND